MQTVIIAYFLIAFFSALTTGVFILYGDEIKGINNFWSFIIYNIFWIVQPIKETVKFFKNIFK